MRRLDSFLKTLVTTLHFDNRRLRADIYVLSGGWMKERRCVPPPRQRFEVYFQLPECTEFTSRHLVFMSKRICVVFYDAAVFVHGDGSGRNIVVVNRAWPPGVTRTSDRAKFTHAPPPNQWQSLSTLPFPRSRAADSLRLGRNHPLRMMSQPPPDQLLCTLGSLPPHMRTLDTDRRR